MLKYLIVTIALIAVSCNKPDYEKPTYTVVNIERNGDYFDTTIIFDAVGYSTMNSGGTVRVRLSDGSLQVFSSGKTTLKRNEVLR